MSEAQETQVQAATPEPVAPIPLPKARKPAEKKHKAKASPDKGRSMRDNWVGMLAAIDSGKINASGKRGLELLVKHSPGHITVGTAGVYLSQMRRLGFVEEAATVERCSHCGQPIGKVKAASKRPITITRMGKSYLKEMSKEARK